MKKTPQDPSPISKQKWQHFGALLRDRRNAAKLSRVDLAHLAKISDATIKFIETARHPPSRSTLIRLLAVVELHLTWADVPGQQESPEQLVPAQPTPPAPPSQASPLQEPVAPSPDPAQFLMNLIGFDEIRLPAGAPKSLRIFQARREVGELASNQEHTDGRDKKW
jgi:transcriptional regulator with XRE-family HTH domain